MNLNRKISHYIVPFVAAIVLSLTHISHAISLNLPGLSNDIVTLEVDTTNNKATANIELIGGIALDLTLQFENVVGLTPESIGISAELIDITDLNLLGRLPGTLNVLQSSFPMLVTIEPLTTKGLSFSGAATIDVHTHNLEYVANTPLRLFKAPLNGTFKDITMTTGKGSYRARGKIGRFSQFLILADLRPTLTVAANKFSHLQNYLQSVSSQIDSTILSNLNNLLDDANDSFTNIDYRQANKYISQFITLVENSSGDEIPNVWRSSRDLENIAGELIASACSLRYSLRLL